MQDRGRIRLIEGFRRHAAALVVEQGQQLGEVAGRLGIDAQLLDRWIRAFTGGNTAATDELMALRREVACLRGKRDVLFAALSLALMHRPGNTATEDSRSPPSTHGNSTAQARTETAQCKGRQP